jgi:thiamine-monophosphate kinase
VEREFHRWLKARKCSADQHDSNVADGVETVGIGDDGAVVDFLGNPLVITTDTIAAGTHFVMPPATDSGNDFRNIGHKALAVSLSDIAAMGGKPIAATLNFQCPNTIKLNEIKQIYIGAEKLASKFGFGIVGGDTNSWNGDLVISSTVVGTKSVSVGGWSLADAKVGDAILVSGEFGGSIHGRHLTFEPRLALSKYIVKNYSIHAATDATDSLTVDLMAIADASGIRCKVDLSKIPISADVRAKDKSTIDHALTDGEDFELIFTLPQEVANRLLDDTKVPTKVTQIGNIISGTPAIVDCRGILIEVKGYDH